MYVWKNVSKRDRRTRPVAPAELHLTKQKTVLAEVEGRAARQRRELEQQRALYKEQEAHEVDSIWERGQGHHAGLLGD